jgi:ABC-type multidrug transport system ATPase subunit
MDGPVLKVIWFEVDSSSQEPGSAVKGPASQAVPGEPVPQIDATPIKAVQPERPAEQKLVKPPDATLEFLGIFQRPPYKIAKPTVWLGRDPDCDIVFDASAATVSRRHAEIRIEGRDYLIIDNNSFNGSLVNGQRITAPVPLYDRDEIQLGMGGPVLRFSAPALAVPAGGELAGQRTAADAGGGVSSKTMVVSLDKGLAVPQASDSGEPQLLMSVGFGEKGTVTIGRDEGNDICLDGLQISKRHAKFTLSGGDALVEDLGSTNGIYVNGSRVTRGVTTPADAVQIGSFQLKLDSAGRISVFDTRAKTRIDAVNITRDIRSRGAKLRLLDGISLSIRPNEFVGMLGPSGAGKSSLIEALNGVRPATAGNVLINNLDLYRHFDSLKQAIGYVPQDDIIHRELTVYRTLYYVAKLRLSRDVSRTEIRRIIDEVLDVTGLSERRNVPVHQLSGGQRKRVSIAVELITKPSVIFLDEPTSGLDPVTEDRIMRLFRQIAESGRTVVMTTHAMENVRLFDKIVLLMRGKVVFYGTPDDALAHLGASSFKELFEKLEAPVETGVREHGEANRAGLVEKTAEGWKQKFHATPQYQELIAKPLKELGSLQPGGGKKRRRLGIFGAIGQWLTLSRRYLEVLFRDKLNLFILFAQAPVIALLTFLVMGRDQPRDFV